MTNIEKLKITDEEFSKSKVAAMATIPSRPSAFGAKALDAGGIKKHFDENPELLRKRFNTLLECLPELASVIRMTISGKDLTLEELIAALTETDKTKLRLTDVLLVGFNGESVSLESAIQRIITAVGKKADAESGRTLASSESVDELARLEEENETSYAVSATGVKEFLTKTLGDTIKSFDELKKKVTEYDGLEEYVKRIYAESGSFGLEFEIKDDGVYLVGIGAARPYDVVIPASFGGRNVVAAEGAINELDDVYCVTVPETVTRITDSFNDLTGLKVLQINSKNIDWMIGDSFKNAGKNSGGVTIYFGAEFSKIPVMMFYTPDGPAVIKQVIFLGEKCKSVGANAFYGSTLSDIELPNGLETIADYAFAGCKSLVNAVLPEGIRELPANVFSGCSALKYCTIPDSLEIFEDWTFKDCPGVDNTTYGVKYIGGKSDGNKILVSDLDAYRRSNVVIDPKTKYILSAAFKGNTTISAVTVPDYVRELRREAFSGCTALKTVTVGAESIAENCFYGCTSLTAVTIGESVKTIGENCFSECSALDSVRFNGGVTEIGKNAFNCSSLTSVHVNSIEDFMRITFIASNSDGSTNFANPLYYARALYHNGEHVRDLAVPESITEIKEYAFRLAWNNDTDKTLLTLKLHSKLSAIGIRAFQSQKGLHSVDWNGCKIEEIPRYCFCNTSLSGFVENGVTSSQIPSSVTKIGAAAFQYCGFTEVEISSGVKVIENAAFEFCSQLKKVYFRGRPERIDHSAFSNCNITDIYVPWYSWETINANAPWGAIGATIHYNSKGD